MFDAVELTIHKMGGYLVVSQAQLDDQRDYEQAVIDNQARRTAMTPAQRAAEDAQWETKRAADKAARTCQHCGCDPDEHGGY